MNNFKLENELKSCKFFSFLEGMPIRIVSKNKKALIYEIDDKKIIIFDDSILKSIDLEDIVPDIKSPAMLGYLLFLVREAWNDPNMCTASCPHGFGSGREWCIFFMKDSNRPPVYRSTEIEAIISALKFREKVEISEKRYETKLSKDII